MARNHLRLAILGVGLFISALILKLLYDGCFTSSTLWTRKIWQTAITVEASQKWNNNITTWRTLNPGWEYNLLTDEDMEFYIHEHFSHRADIVGVWDELKLPIAKADLFRYLILFQEGGVYTDLDTTNIVSIDEWIPPNFSRAGINVVAGLEYADHTYRIFPRQVSFCQWTLMTRPRSMVYENVINKVIARLEHIARVQKVPIANITLSREETLAATGPGAYSDAVLATIRQQLRNPSLDWDVFYGLQEPQLFGDVLVLPINGFGAGQKHSNSSKPDWGQVYTQHHFGSSWFKKKKPRPNANEKSPKRNRPQGSSHN